jgi:hypothetical protein
VDRERGREQLTNAPTGLLKEQACRRYAVSFAAPVIRASEQSVQTQLTKLLAELRVYL